MATILKRKIKKGHSYTAMVRCAGQPQQNKTFSRRIDAERWASETERKIRTGELVPSAMTFQDAFYEYAKILDQKKEHFKYSNIARLRWWNERIGGAYLGNVTRAQVKQYREELLSTGVTTATANRYVSALSALFTYARDREWVQNHPIQGQIKRLTESKPRDEVLTVQEKARLLEACKADSEADDILLLVSMALDTAARQNELMKVRWRDVNLDTGRVLLLETKNGDARQTTVSDKILDMIKARKPADAEPEDYLFGRSRYWGKYRIAWERVRTRAGLPKFRFHSLRHTAITWMASTPGINAVMLQKFSGHRTMQMLKRYSHLTDDDLAAAQQKMRERLEEK